MNIVFAGTPDFAVPTLKALLASAHRVHAVYTQPDRPAGRGRKPAASPIKQCALAHTLPVYQPESLKHAEAELAAMKPDAMIVAAYGLILPSAILAVPRYGCINVHASLLPRWRGAAPIQRAILAGDRTTGISIMQMERGLDTGPVLAQRGMAITDDDTAASLHDRLAILGAELLVATLDRLEAGAVAAHAQHEADVTYAHKLHKDEARIDWREPAALIARKVRAFNPWPAAYFVWNDEPVRVWAAHVEPSSQAAAPGAVIGGGAGIAVATGDGVLVIDALQRAGGKRLDAAAFVRGHPLAPGTALQ